MGGSLKISLSNGWFSIRYHLCMMIFFRFGTEGRYSVTNGSIFLIVRFCFVLQSRHSFVMFDF